MTSEVEKRAIGLADECMLSLGANGFPGSAKFKGAIARAIADAVEDSQRAERKACADLCEARGQTHDDEAVTGACPEARDMALHHAAEARRCARHILARGAS